MDRVVRDVTTGAGRAGSLTTVDESSLRPRFSIIVPVHREEAGIAGFLAELWAIIGRAAGEVLVVDAALDTSTLAAIADPRVVKMTSAKGRGRQMNIGAGAARGQVLIFLHADTRLPSGALNRIDRILADPSVVGGAFDLRLESASPLVRMVGLAGTVRSRLTRVPYGDQAIFLRRDFFLAQGGYAEIPLMEDLELMCRLRRAGHPIRFIAAPVRSSGRRWEKEGVVKGTARNWLLRLLYHAGVSPTRLAAYYR